jgi:radical SAM-linked protein
MKSSRFLGHLEMVKIFIRSFRRERIPLKYSGGFHPMPKVSFGDTLPMGMQSEEEQMLVTLTEAIDPESWFYSCVGNCPTDWKLLVVLRISKRRPWNGSRNSIITSN